MEHQTTRDVRTVFHAVSQQKSLNAGFFHLLPDKLQAANYWNDGVVRSSGPLERRVQCSEMKLLWYEARHSASTSFIAAFSPSLSTGLCHPCGRSVGGGREKGVFLCSFELLGRLMVGLEKKKRTILSITQQNLLLYIHARWPCI